MTNQFYFYRKFWYRYIILALILCLTGYAKGQKENKIFRDSIFLKFADSGPEKYSPDHPYYIATWDKNLPAGITQVRQFDDRTAIVQINNQQAFDSLRSKLKFVSARDTWKLSPYAERQMETDGGTEFFFILSGPDLTALLKALQDIEGRFRIISADERSSAVMIRTTVKFLKQRLLGLTELSFVDIRAKPQAETAIIGYDRSFHGINAVDYSIPGANGKNIVVGVKEQKMDENDIDLLKRVLASSIASANVTNHATVISSIIGGAGNSFYDGRGIAYACKFFPSSFENLFADNQNILTSNKVSTQNHAYGTVIQQFYGAEALSYDAQTWSIKNMIHVFSAGNKGVSFAVEGKYANLPGFSNLTGNFKMAKNIITVGAMDNKGNIPAESSVGPIYDGRLAPQLVALGPNGTSDAAAVVSGTIAVMQQVYADSNSNTLPASSLIKSVLYNNADDVYRKGIDYKTGYGQLNSFVSIQALQRKEYDPGTLVQGQQWTKLIAVPANAARLKVTLAWTDSTAQLNNFKAIINDLDLEVQEMSSGMIYKPWVLSAAANTDSLMKEPVRKRDSLNTAEQVSIDLPPAGNYQVKVTGTSVITSSSDFSISYHIDTLNTFRFISPQHASDINIEEDPEAFIRWRSFVADTNQTGDLYISYNRGADWQLIRASQKLYTNFYVWPIKDTNSTALLKMETSFGNFLSREFIISRVTRPSIDFLCADSFGLSWNKHVFADNYKIYSLTDSPYLKHIITLPDTFIVLNRSLFPSRVYAVEPILNNGIPAARSQAIDITQQGIKCFYKTFYYNLQDQNILDLVLELSEVAHVDSIFFGQVSAAGVWLADKGSAKVITGNRIYRQPVIDVPAGVSYWRARIKLKDGSILYTDVISVLTTGTRYIRFYPNPVNRNATLNFVLRQGTGSDSRLQIFDISGRLLRSYSEMPNNINIAGLAAGVLIYKLYSFDGQLLETGKLSIW
jgi:hypothetical protein